MIARTLTATVLALGLFAPAAQALIIATGPDDICLPTDDPCIVDQDVQVQPPGTLDFGARTLQITGAGRLLGTATITCGDFLVDVGVGLTAVDTRETGNVAGSFSVTARRACSGNPQLACLNDAFCQSGGFGTCSVGAGQVDIAGDIVSQGNPGGFVLIRAVGDITVSGDVLTDGNPIGAEGGQVEIRSYTGSVTTSGAIRSNANEKGINYETIIGGITGIYAAGDVTASGPLDVGESANGGVLTIEGDSVVVQNSVNAAAGAGMQEGTGGRVEITAWGDITLTGSGAGGTGTVKVNLNGSSGGSSYYGSPYVGYGGYAMLKAYAGDITVADPVTISSNSGQNGNYGGPYGGYVQFYAGSRMTLDGTITALGYSKYGHGGVVTVSADHGFDMGPSSAIKTRSKYGGEVQVYAGSGASRIDGKIDVRGKLAGSGYYSYEGEGGEVYLYGLADVTMDGKILQGAETSNPIDISVCRLRLLDNARLDNTLGSPDNREDVNIEVYESMYAAPGSKILADAAGGGSVFIEYRDVNKRPILLGQISPSPTLIDRPNLRGCPVCGNSEIDKGESCDDGNTTSGDGCRDDCQDEGCLAATPGWPAVALCDDGNGCTSDVCDPFGHQCLNTLACGDNIFCTIDSCVAGACDHAPDDLACDDRNPCTDDVCNPTTGCVHANLTGIPCDDGDPCTVTGTCDTGFCAVTDRARSSKSRLKFRFLDGAADDKMSFKADLSLSDLMSAPDVTGVTVDLFDRDGQSVFSATVPASGFVDKKGTGQKFQFKDRDGAVPGAGGIRLFKIQKNTKKSLAKVKFKAQGTELPGAEGEFLLSMSMLFGADPAVDECITAWQMFCRPKPGKNKCKR